MEYGCETCTGACCTRLMKLPLNLLEVEFLRTAGTIMTPLLPAEDGVSWRDRLRAKTSSDPVMQDCIVVAKTLDVGQGYYQLQTDCGYLATDSDWRRCTVFDSPDRPNVCHEFPAQSAGCHLVRLSRGLPFDLTVINSANTNGI